MVMRLTQDASVHMHRPQPGRIYVTEDEPIQLIFDASGPLDVCVRAHGQLVWSGPLKEARQGVSGHLVSVEQTSGGWFMTVEPRLSWPGHVVVVEVALGDRPDLPLYVVNFFPRHASAQLGWEVHMLGIRRSNLSKIPAHYIPERIFGQGGGVIVFREPEVVVDMRGPEPVIHPLPPGIFSLEPLHIDALVTATTFCVVLAAPDRVFWVSPDGVQVSMLSADRVIVDSDHVHLSMGSRSLHRHILNPPLPHESGEQGFDVVQWPAAGLLEILGAGAIMWSEREIYSAFGFSPVMGAQTAVRWTPDLLRCERFESVALVEPCVARVNERWLIDIDTIDWMNEP